MPTTIRNRPFARTARAFAPQNLSGPARRKKSKLAGMDETRSSLLLRVRDTADAESWREFVELYQPLLVAYIRNKGLQDSDAHDVTQDVLTKLHRTMPTFELNRTRGRFRTWLWQVACNAISDWARRQRRREGAEEGWRGQFNEQTPGPDDEPDEEWITAYRKRVLAFALERVRSQSQAKTWQCFEEHVLRGRPSAEVGAELGLSANAVNANASRVLARVRQQSAEYMEELADDE